VKNKYWEIIHDGKQGGSITSIRFYNGTNRSILVKPIQSFIGPFQDILNKNTSMKAKYEDGKIIIEINGKLKTLNEIVESDISYNYIYEYHDGYCKIKENFSIPKGLGGINEVGIGCMEIVPEMRYFAARSSHISAQDKIPLANSWAEKIARCPAHWGEISFEDKVYYEERNVPLYLGVYNVGVEGIEFIPAADLEEWCSQIVKDRDRGCYQIRGETNPNRVRIIIQPLSRGHSLVLSGTYHFTYYLGLPMIPKKIPRKIRHMTFNPYPWPTEEDIKRWAYSGVNVVRLHNDYHPSGYFWHDGSWPPYDEKGMEELKRVIETCHRYGIKVVPYFSLFEINAKSDAFPDNHTIWRRTIDRWGSILETYPPHYYGFVMCLKSGWKDFLKEYIKKVIDSLGFDGVYYDHADYWFCNNKIHSKGDHSTIEDLIEFLEWTRSFLGEERLILLHQSGWFPCMIIENYADGHIMFEDNVAWKEVPPLEDWPLNTMHIRFNIAPKLPVPAAGVNRVRGLWNLCSKCAILGAFPYSGLGKESEAVLKLIEIFRAFDLSEFEFKDYTFGLVDTDNAAIKGAVYFQEDRAIVVLSNITDKNVEKFNWKLKLSTIGLDSSLKYCVTDSLGREIYFLDGDALSTKGMEDHLDSFQFKAYYIVRHLREKKYVISNTRIWKETYNGVELRVETQGPLGQEASLKFYSPEKPKTIKINSKILSEKDWNYDDINSIGTINYIFDDTKKTVIIEIL
jgi:hypothetical protein